MRNILISPELNVNSLSSAASKSYKALTLRSSFVAVIAAGDGKVVMLFTEGYKDADSGWDEAVVNAFLGEPIT